MFRLGRRVLAPLFLIACAAPLCTADGRTPLPQTQPYQQALRAFLGKLAERDFDHGVTEPLTAVGELTPEEQYRHFVMSMMHQPLVGWKRGTPAINAPSRLFLLTTIEGPLPPELAADAPPAAPAAAVDPNAAPDYTPVPIPVPTGIVVPPVWPETLAAFTNWNYAGNPYFNNRGLKLRAFVTAAVKMMMLDDYFEQNPDARRADWNAYQLVTFAATYEGTKDAVPAEAQQAYVAGLRRMAKMMLAWGPRGDEPNKDMTLPVGLWYAARVVGNEKLSAEVEMLARTMLTDPRYFDAAGYWVEKGHGLDVGFGGGANFYAAWLALLTDWPFARETVDKAYRLRAHLCFPDPDGFVTGPSHFNHRLGSPASSDQWGWDGARDAAAAMITDEALPFIKQPTPELLTGAAASRVAWFNSQIKQNPVRPDVQGRKSTVRTGYWANDDLRGHTWTWRLWQTYNFPIGINPGFDFYRTGTYERLAALQAADSPLLKLPCLRDEAYLQNLSNEFIAAKRPTYAALLHVGPVADVTTVDGAPTLAGPPGFGGGQLSAFWTRATGAVILGRRIGTSAETNFDDPEQWRNWPLHAVTGLSSEGELLTSARIVRPQVATDFAEQGGTVTVAGELSPAMPNTPASPTHVAYTRSFEVKDDGVRVVTKVQGKASTRYRELYETIPVYLRDVRRQPMAPPTFIEFQVGGAWQTATAKYQANVAAVRLTRFNNSVTIEFDRPQRVKLSPADWRDTYLTQAACRNVLVDLQGGDGPDTPVGGRSVEYCISAVEKR